MIFVKTRRAEHRHAGTDEMQRAKAAHKLAKYRTAADQLGTSPLRPSRKRTTSGAPGVSAPAIDARLIFVIRSFVMRRTELADDAFATSGIASC